MNLRFAALLLAILLVLAGCGPKEDINEPEITTYEDDPAPTNYEEAIRMAPKVDVPSDFYHIPFPPNDQGHYEVVVPVNLLGGKNAEGVVKEYDIEKDLGSEGLLYDIQANPDGTATYVFSEYQFLSYKYLMYVNPHREFNSIVSVEYEDSERMTSIVVTVDTVKDDETGETISQWKFPFDNMYKTFDWLAPQTPLTDSGGEGSADEEANE